MSTIIGLDIGAGALRAVAASHGKGGMSVRSSAALALPPHVATSGQVLDQRQFTEALKQLVSNGGFGTKDVVIGAAGQNVSVREVELPRMNRTDLMRSLPFQARDIIALPIEDALLDFHPFGGDEQGPTMRGLLVAVPREPVLDSVRAVERAGLRVKHVDLASFAALRAVGQVDGVVEAILDLGRTATTLVVHRDGVPSIVRALPHGGAEVTELLAKRMALSLEAAEALKREIRIDTGPGAHSRLGAGDESDDGPQALAQAVRPLIAETRNSLSYHASLHPEWTVNRILLCGGGAALLGLTELFSQEFGVPVDIGDPLQRLPASSDGHAPATSAVAVGLALRAVA